MRVRAILNRESGTLKSVEMAEFSKILTDAFVAADHEIEIVVTEGAHIGRLIAEAGADENVEVLIAGGGDGTVSSAACVAWKTGKALGVLPAGTLNLFARATGVPLDLNLAATALAGATIEDADIATANGRPFVHQFSVGLQPQVVRMREKMSYTTRLGKMLIGARALIKAFARPPRFPAIIDLDGKIVSQSFSMLILSNNLFGEGHIPYPDILDGGVLGVYYAGDLNAERGLKLASDFALDGWSGNGDLQVLQAHEAHLRFPKVKKSSKAALDGEIIDLEAHVHVVIHPKALKILRPGML